MTVADAIDAKRSKLSFSSPGRIFPSTIDRYEFVASKVGRLAIFRIPESLTDAFVTEPFAERVRRNALDGFDLVKVWPLPANVDWRKQRRAASRKRDRAELPKGRSLKGNSVIIRLRLSGKGKGTRAERRHVEELMDQIDALLVQPGARSPAVGSLEGSEFAVDGECRLFLSCPDADALAAKLRPLLRRFRWKPGLVMVKRDAPYSDPDALERVERISRRGVKP